MNLIVPFALVVKMDQLLETLVTFLDQGLSVEAAAAARQALARTPEQLEIYLKMMAKDDYKALTTQEAWKKYEKSFKGSFKN